MKKVIYIVLKYKKIFLSHCSKLLGKKEVWTEKDEENIFNFLKRVLIQTSFLI
jgi:hypothetical protein